MTQVEITKEQLEGIVRKRIDDALEPLIKHAISQAHIDQYKIESLITNIIKEELLKRSDELKPIVEEVVNSLKLNMIDLKATIVLDNKRK